MTTLPAGAAVATAGSARTKAAINQVHQPVMNVLLRRMGSATQRVDAGTLGATRVRVKVSERFLARADEPERLGLSRAAEQPSHGRSRGEAEPGHHIIAAHQRGRRGRQALPLPTAQQIANERGARPDRERRLSAY